MAGLLAADFYVQESKAYIKSCMLSTLRKCKPPSQPPTQPTVLLIKVPQEPLTMGFYPTLLLGPSGCGKTTLLESIATTLSPTAPVVLVRMRLPGTQPEGRGAFSTRDGKTLMDATASQIFSQIGFPVRRSFIGGALARGFTLLGEITKVEHSPETSDRLVAALLMLFEVCEELKLEREKTMPPLDAAPVLLFDEVQDLIKDERLRRAGGQIVLDMLGALLVGYCMDRKAVRAVIAGSSAELNFAFSTSGPLNAVRWEDFDLEDPPEAAVCTALVAKGYNLEEACSMTQLCGTRLRLLQAPLTRGASTHSAAEFLRKARAKGRAALAGIFSQLSPADAKLLAKVLDGIEACDALKGAGMRPVKEGLPPALKHFDLAPLLFVDREHALFFQSQLVKNTWGEVRQSYVYLT